MNFERKVRSENVKIDVKLIFKIQIKRLEERKRMLLLKEYGMEDFFSNKGMQETEAHDF